LGIELPSMNEAEICAKCVEVSKSLLNTSIGMVALDLRNTISIGDMARLAVSIRRTGEIQGKTFNAISTALKIDPRISESQILNEFENLSWVDIKRDGRHIKRIDEHIPPTEDVLGRLGKLWHEYEPSIIDLATVKSLKLLSKRPYSKEALLSELNAPVDKFQITLDYGQQANYLGTFTSIQQEKEMVWTPLYWTGKTDDVLRYIEKQDEDALDKIGELTRNISRQPGMPIEKIMNRQNVALINSGIYYGYFPSVAINIPSKKKYEYLFSAAARFNPDPDRDVYEKAKLIVSCIRHGQYHAEVTKILYPLSILRAMRNNTMKPHPYAHIQYFLLKTHGIVDIKEDRTRHGKAYRVIWIDTPENNFAGDIAEQMLLGMSPLPPSIEDLETKKIIVEGIFKYTSEQRRIRATKQVMANNEYKRLMEETLGVRL